MHHPRTGLLASYLLQRNDQVLLPINRHFDCIDRQGSSADSSYTVANLELIKAGADFFYSLLFCSSSPSFLLENRRGV